MIDAMQFQLLLQRAKIGDQEAAGELMRQFEPFLHREVRLRLEDQRLRQAYDTMDISQSVLKSFFVRAAVGEFTLEHPRQFLALLVKMTRRKVVARARHEYRQKRDRRRVVCDVSVDLNAVPGHEPTPSVAVAGAELIERARQLLSPEERSIAELRAAACSWEEVAQRLGGTAQARRVQFRRAMQRVINQLGIGVHSDA